MKLFNKILLALMIVVCVGFTITVVYLATQTDLKDSMKNSIVNGASTEQKDLVVGWDTLIVYSEPPSKWGRMDSGKGKILVIAGDLAYTRELHMKQWNWAIVYTTAVPTHTQHIVYLWED